MKDYLVEQLKRPAPLLVLNRVGLSSANELSTKEFAKNYGHEVALHLPFVHEVVAATAQGELLSSSSKLAGVLAPLTSLARSLCGELAGEAGVGATRETGGGLLQRLKGKK